MNSLTLNTDLAESSESEIGSPVESKTLTRLFQFPDEDLDDEKTPVPKTHHLPLKTKYENSIRDGLKTVELRLDNTRALKGARENDEILFNSRVRVRIESITNYPSLHSAIATCEFRKCIPEATSIEEAIGVYKKLPNWSKALENPQRTIMALHICYG